MEQLESRKIAIRYAKALFDSAQEQGVLDQVRENINRIQGIYLEVPEMNVFFQNPAIPLKEKQDLIQNQFKKGLPPMLGNFLELLLENDRMIVLPDIIAAFIDLINQKEGAIQAEVTVPVPMKSNLEEQLRTSLEKLFGYQQVELNVKVDPAIIAGAIVKIGDKIIDGSYHGKLEMLRRQVG